MSPSVWLQLCVSEFDSEANKKLEYDMGEWSSSKSSEVAFTHRSVKSVFTSQPLGQFVLRLSLIFCSYYYNVSMLFLQQCNTYSIFTTNATCMKYF